jgi:hypothetical protein
LPRPTFPRILIDARLCEAIGAVPARTVAIEVGIHESQLSLLINSRSVAATGLMLDRLNKLAALVGYTGSLGVDMDTGSPLPPSLEANLVAVRRMIAKGGR